MCILRKVGVGKPLRGLKGGERAVAPAELTDEQTLNLIGSNRSQQEFFTLPDMQCDGVPARGLVLGEVLEGIAPGEWERRSGLLLRFIYRRRGPSLLVAEGRLNSKGRAVASKSKTGRGLTTVAIFLLVPQVKLRKRLDLAREAARAVDGVPGRIVVAWMSRQD